MTTIDDERARVARQARMFGEGGVTALEAAKIAAADMRTGSAGGVTLRPYQVEAGDAVVKLFDAGTRRVIVNLPTGCGKTVFGFALARCLGKRLLWLAHRDELLQQPLKTVARVWPEVERGLVQADRNEWNRHVVVGSVQTLSREGRLAQILRDPFGLVVVDECHHVASDTYRRVLEGVGCFTEGGPPCLGLTATLERADGVGLGTVFQEIAYSLSLHDAIDRGYLAPFRGERVEPAYRPEVRALIEELLGKKPKRPSARPEEDDFDVEGRKLETAQRELLFQGVAEGTARAVADHARDRKVIVFTCTIDQAKRTVAELVKLGIRAEHVSGLMPRQERHGVLERLHTGETRVVCNAQVLTEGFDEPSVDCVVVARPTKSRSLYVQMVGRGLRLYPGKRDCLLIDIVFASALGLQTAATLADREATTLFSGGGGNTRERDPESAAEEEEKRVLAMAAASLGESVPADGRRQRVEGPRWLDVAPGACWALDLWQHGTLVVERVPADQQPPGTEALFQAFVMPRGRAPSVRVSEPGPFEWVFGVAEDYLRNSLSEVLSGSPRWKKAPPSARQLQELARRGIDIAPRTGGDAADLLTCDTVRSRLGY